MRKQGERAFVLAIQQVSIHSMTTLYFFQSENKLVSSQQQYISVELQSMILFKVQVGTQEIPFISIYTEYDYLLAQLFESPHKNWKIVYKWETKVALNCRTILLFSLVENVFNKEKSTYDTQ